MQQRISLITLGVNDLQGSKKFYEKLGWRASNISNDKIVFFQLNGLIFSLFPKEELAKDAKISSFASGPSRIFLAHNLPTKNEVDTLLKNVERAGGKIVKKGQDTDWGGYSGYFSDPNGFLWEIAWNPHFPIDAEGNIKLP